VLCPFTGSDELEWREASGLGTVAATTVVHRRDELPYSVVLVDTDEGFRLMSRVDGVDPGEVTIGLRVRAQVLGTGVDETPFPVFEPAEVRS
jgi:uncharacterized OB-fold protein